jgi:DNA-binding XRE family transcriptional regulator
LPCNLFKCIKNNYWYPIPWFFVRQPKTIMGMAKPSPQFGGDPVLIALGAEIRRARAGIGLSQEALAVDAGLDRSYVGGIERGEHNITIMLFRTPLGSFV